jgi:hypothetical protein
MTDLFQFEADFVDSLRCIPMVVRYRLDTCGVKLKLQQWNQMDLATRSRLVEMDTDSATAIENYRQVLIDLIWQVAGEEASLLAIDPQPPWQNDREIPAEILQKAQLLGCNLKLDRWKKLSSLQRFVLIKLTKSSHEQNNFLPALREFKLM